MLQRQSGFITLQQSSQVSYRGSGEFCYWLSPWPSTSHSHHFLLSPFICPPPPPTCLCVHLHKGCLLQVYARFSLCSRTPETAMLLVRICLLLWQSEDPRTKAIPPFGTSFPLCLSRIALFGFPARQMLYMRSLIQCHDSHRRSLFTSLN